MAPTDRLRTFEQLQEENNALKEQVKQLSQDLGKSREKLEAEVIKEYELMEKLSELDKVKKNNERLKGIISELMAEVKLERAKLDIVTQKQQKKRQG